jgi:hypothetical protein
MLQRQGLPQSAQPNAGGLAFFVLEIGFPLGHYMGNEIGLQENASLCGMI